MVDKTKHLSLEYLSEVGETLSPQVESRRFTTIDTQLQAIFKALGNGRVSNESSWNLLTEEQLNSRVETEGLTPLFDTSYFVEDPTGLKNNRFLHLTVGGGIVNNMAVETLKIIKIGYLPYVINYI